jgi:hypothetical protein
MHREHYTPPRAKSRFRLLLEWLALSLLVSGIGIVIGLGV